MTLKSSMKLPAWVFKKVQDQRIKPFPAPTAQPPPAIGGLYDPRLLSKAVGEIGLPLAPTARSPAASGIGQPYRVQGVAQLPMPDRPVISVPRSRGWGALPRQRTAGVLACSSG